MFKKVLAMLALVISVNAFAEASFNQVESLIEQKNYQSASIALEGIIANHPNSAKAFYAMSQAQAGLGNLQKAQYALDKARALDPDLKFASSSNIESLQQAITPQVKKIEVVEETHYWRNFLVFAMFCVFGWACYFFWCTYNRKKDEEEGCGGNCGGCGPKPSSPTPPTPQAKVDAVNSQPLRTPAPSSYAPPPAPAPAPVASGPTVVNNHYGSNNDGFVTGMLVGNMLSGSHHDHTTVIERDVYVPTPPPSYTPAPSRDSSWDDDSSSRSSSKSSSWDDDSSSSKSSSSWSSSSSDSDSSWSSSSSSDSSWGDSGSSSDSW